MSEYFRVLNRLLEEGQSAHAPEARHLQPVPVVAARARLETHESKPRHPDLHEVKGRHNPAPVPLPVEIEAPAQPGASEELIALLESARHGAGSRSLVLAPASGSENAEQLISQVGILARERGLRIAVFHASDAGSAPPRHHTHGEVRFAVGRADLAAQIESWRATLPNDAVALLIAPALARNQEAALLARACDGLVVVVELGKTPRRALANATKRASAAGAAVLGLIVIGSDGIPRWARRLLQNDCIEG